MHFIVAGLNHKTANIEVREKLYFHKDELAESLNALNKYSSIQGCVILSTCNRVEIYASVDKIDQGFNDITEFICQQKSIAQDILVPALYKKNCQLAVTHLFKVASSIDSMVIGECQIQGQVRDAYFFANEKGFTNNLINKLFQTAISTGKRVRSETEIGKGSVSVATLAVELIKQVFHNREKFNVLLVGAGEMTEATANNLQQFKSCKITVTNRSHDKAAELANKIKGSVEEFSERYEAVKNADIIIVSTGATHYTLEYNEIAAIMTPHPHRVKIFIDLSIPRNIDPEIGKLENSLLYSIDDINNMINLNLSKRSLEIEKAECIIEQVSHEYYDWYYKQYIIPTMREIKGELDVLKQRTFAVYKSDLGHINPEQHELISKMMDSYSDRLIKVIMKNIKNSTTKEDLISITETLRQTFTIDVSEE